jgi:tetratricopeptide (TPR) repeat protein
VIGRSTAFTFKGKAVDLKQIGRDLNVRFVLEGSVQRGGGRMRVNVQLIEAENGAHVWAERFDKPVVDLFEMQDEIVSRLANCLGVELVKAEALRAINERPNAPDALDLAMQGWSRINSGFNKANYDAAIPWFERALQRDPELTWAQVGLAWGLVDRAFSFRGGNEAEDLPRAEALIARALSVDPNSAWAHFVKADLLTYGKRQSARRCRSWTSPLITIEISLAPTRFGPRPSFSTGRPKGLSPKLRPHCA